MIGTIVSAIIGSDIDKAEGGTGTGGAIAGALAPFFIKRVIPLAVLIGGVFAVKSYLETQPSAGEAA